MRFIITQLRKICYNKFGDRMDCIFCKIINGDIPSYKIYEDETVYSFLDINPKGVGHTLVIPKKHFKDLDDIDLDTLKHINEITKMLKKRIEEKLNPDGIQIVQNNGCLQEVKHYHTHIIPAYLTSKDMTVEEVYEILK